LKLSFIDFTKVVFYDFLKADRNYSAPIAYMKHHLSDLEKVAFYDAKVAENS
jgi:hypothetical protein